MRHGLSAIAFAVTLLPLPLAAQCFNHAACSDPSALEVRSQISVNVPVTDQTAVGDERKTMADARQQLYTFADRECETLRATFGGDCSLSSININSSVQDRPPQSKAIFASVSATYQVKRAAKP